MGWTNADLVREAGLLAVAGFGWTESKPPPIEPKTVGMMGLRGVEGLNIVRKESGTVSGRAGGGGGVQRGMKNVRGGGGGSVRMNVNGPGRDTV